MIDFDEKLTRRFWAKVERTGGPDACWPWTASTTNGSGYIRIVLWEMTTGIDPGELHVLHRCDNPPCCNPKHLVLGTHAENMADRDAKGRMARGAGQPRAKLTEADVIEIRRSDDMQKDIADRFGVSAATISRIRAGLEWRHVPMYVTAREATNQGAGR
jgi:hypothetical protein